MRPGPTPIRFEKLGTSVLEAPAAISRANLSEI
jgi:hypothetical protein